MMNTPLYPAPSASTDTFWTAENRLALAGKEAFPEGMSFYRPSRDYVGPQASYVIRRLASRYTYGVDFNRAAYRHDFHYAVGGTSVERLEADNTFYHELKEAIATTYPAGCGTWKAFKRFLAKRRAYKCWKFVRAFGSAFFTYKDRM